MFDRKNEVPIGISFGSLVVIGPSEKRGSNRHRYCRVRCVCGEVFDTDLSNLLRQKTKTCRRCAANANGRKHKALEFRARKGKSQMRLYRTWSDMKSRCYNPRTRGYKYYGAKGVCVCDEWLHDFQSFAKWAWSNGYDDSLTIDRINPFGNYTPSNCRFVTWKIQQNNKRINFL